MRKLFLLLLVWAVALLPMEFFFMGKYMLAPEGFWQNLILVGAGFYFMGAVQLFMGIGGVAATIFVLARD